MNHPTSEQDLNRRDFMKASAAATAAGLMVNGAAGAAVPPLMKKPGEDGLIHRNERPSMSYRKLGRTNFMCSKLVFGCGAALAGGKAVRLLDRALEAGINFYDVGSNVYYKGSERYLAPFLKANRDEIWVTSKAPFRFPKGYEVNVPLTVEQAKECADYWVELLDQSLIDLDTEYMDAYYLMAVPDPVFVKCEELYNAFTRAKEAGKVGHFGISTHKRADECLEAAIETGWYDLAMIAITPAGWYEWDQRQIREGTPTMVQAKPLLQRAREAGIGLVGMKAGRFLAPATSGGRNDDTAFDAHYDEKFKGAGLSGHQRAYAFVLEHGVDVVNADMQNFEHLEANLVATAQSATYFA